jgi:hypothetical protein
LLAFRLITLNTHIQVLVTSNPAKELACINIGIIAIRDSGINRLFSVARALFWVGMELAMGYWMVVGLACIPGFELLVGVYLLRLQA